MPAGPVWSVTSVSEHLLGEGSYLLGRPREAHATLVAGLRFLELALAASAGVDLGFDHPERAGQVPHRHVYVAEGVDRLAAQDRHAEFAQDGLSLVFVDVHGSERSPALIRPRRVG